jgi:hypothetical protein
MPHACCRRRNGALGGPGLGSLAPRRHVATLLQAHARSCSIPATRSFLLPNSHATRPALGLLAMAAANGNHGGAALQQHHLVLPASFQEQFVDVAHQLADAAGSVTRQYFR